MDDSALSRVNALLTDPITDADLSRYRSGERRCRDEKTRGVIVAVLGREAGECYNWQAACDRAEIELATIKDENMELRQNMTFNYSRCTWGRFYPWIILSIGIAFGLALCVRPWINYKAMKASAGYLVTIEEYAARAAEAEAKAELYGQILEEVVADWQEIYERLEVER